MGMVKEFAGHYTTTAATRERGTIQEDAGFNLSLQTERNCRKQELTMPFQRTDREKRETYRSARVDAETSYGGGREDAIVSLPGATRRARAAVASGGVTESSFVPTSTTAGQREKRDPGLGYIAAGGQLLSCALQASLRHAGDLSDPSS
jgi:hypothetical protein